MESINKRQGSLILYHTWEYGIYIGEWGKKGYLSQISEVGEEKRAGNEGRINSFHDSF